MGQSALPQGNQRLFEINLAYLRGFVAGLSDDAMDHPPYFFRAITRRIYADQYRAGLEAGIRKQLNKD